MARLLPLLITAALAVGLIAAGTSSAHAPCGKVAAGGIAWHIGKARNTTCRHARYVFRTWQRTGRPPRGWSCALSARACGKGRASFAFHQPSGY